MLPFLRRTLFVFVLVLAVFSVSDGDASAGRPAPGPPVIKSPIVIRAFPLTDAKGAVNGVSIPLKRAGRLLLLEATVDQVTGNFILDTGSSELVLNRTYFRGGTTYYDQEGGGVTGATAPVTRLQVKQLSAGELGFTNLSADVVPLGHLENRRGVKILGLFGMSLLGGTEVVLDIRGSELQIHRVDKTGRRLGAASPVATPDLVQKIDLFHKVMFVKASIAGKLLTFCLDTGAESNVLSIHANKNVLAAVSITRRSGLCGSGQNNCDVLYGTLNDFTIGNHPMAPMATIVCSLSEMSQKYDCPLDGMLGFDFFAKGRFSINLVKKEMAISLNREEAK